MISVTRRNAMVLAASGLFAGALSATKAEADLADGTASGTLTVNGKTTNVTHAYARQVPGFFDANTKDTLVIVSDVALDDAALKDDFARIDLAKAGKLHAFEITIDAEGKPISTVWRHNGFGDAMPSGLSSGDVFTKKVLDDKFVEGSYRSDGEQEFFDNHFAFDVSFRAAVAH